MSRPRKTIGSNRARSVSTTAIARRADSARRALSQSARTRHLPPDPCTPEERPRGKHVPHYPALTFDLLLGRYIADVHHPSNAEHCNNGMIDVQTVAGLTGKTVSSYYKAVQRGTGLQPDFRTPDNRLWFDPRRVAFAAAPPTEDEAPIFELLQRARSLELSTQAALAQAVYDMHAAFARTAQKNISEMRAQFEKFSDVVDETTSVEEFEQLGLAYKEFCAAWEWNPTRNQPRDPEDPRWKRS